MGKRRGSAKLYIAVIADVVRSREVADREALRQRLKRALRAVNGEFRDIVVAPLTLTAGDEFQGLLRPSGKVVALVNTLAERLFPLRIRAGIGIGPVTTRVTRRPQEMDGPVFQRAREALGETKRMPSGVVFRTQDETFDLAANSIALLSHRLRERWKALHWRRAAMRDRGLSEKEIAEREGVSQAAVHYSLASCGYHAVRQAEAGLAALVDRWWSEGSVE